ncbi:hypothetical protein A2954_07115 [Candidatus Roizmanbacteria bacterium RIFCSPLOWO2_01_FULL_37_12]|uniref:Glycosyltransferase 2-like domain-containing protein n=1 Tax=Candidatus Roizmanbacteria bacterium RIFCSPLOWO2_01_FULL_37_12 TaxID=1802056 RepID=A0A1F7IE43_9BACT|nr:MAG: hypothetical protein A3D76_02420 [Candidatus Roizmanbacteria bacterium RIFCSPHIGHO2_02_FULL_37_9b]OGK41622.1 MAG: hypothetical protein A2954_07115 [Candidatus Roizmanbacteria bacterium RIFCSPLOWO2_01_FULL_37_12]
MNLTNISIIIHTFNDEKKILDCINSAKLLSKQIIVIDMHSQDNTVELAKNTGAEVYFFSKSNYVEPAREFGIEKAKTEWVLILDTDERITHKLSQEIRYSILVNRQKKSNFIYPITNIAAYRIPRKNIFGKNKWLKYGGWWPDYQTRLISKKFFKSWPKEIHSTPIVSGELAYMHNPIIHYFHGNLESMVEKTIIFEDIESDLLFNAKKEVNISVFFRKFLGELYRRLFRNLGFLDGEIGIIESIYQAFSKTITYIYLYEKSRAVRSLP